MARAITFARQISGQPAEIARIVIVVACALALIFAEQALPF